MPVQRSNRTEISELNVLSVIKANGLDKLQLKKKKYNKILSSINHPTEGR